MFNLFKKKKQFMPLYDRIAKQIMDGEILTPAGDQYKKSSARNYKAGAYRFHLWEKEHGRIFLEDINKQWADSFIFFQMQKGYCKNSIANTMARLKAILRRLYIDGISQYNGAGISCSNESVTAIYSSIEDIQALINTDLTDTPGFTRVRDIYIMQCFIGLRYSDLVTVMNNPKQYLRSIGNKFFIEVKTKKTNEVVVIPVAKVVIELLKRYDYNMGTMFSNWYYNRSIKDVALRAGLIDEVVFSRTEGGQRIDTVQPKWSLMSSHTARRTFATNAFLSGLAEKNIMMITGHKTTAAFHKYIRCTNIDAAIKVANHDFFNLDLGMPLSLPESDISSIKVIE